MNIGAIVQARLSSSRLPGKVLLPLGNESVLWHVLNRLKYSKRLHTIVLATSTKPEDRQLKDVADELGIATFFGSLDDVLARYYHAAKQYEIDPIVRITADCPLIDPEIVDEVIEAFLAGSYDVCSLSGEFPNGLETRVFSFKALSEAYNEAKLPSEREHVGGAFFEKNRHRFKVGGYEKLKGKADYRWTIDEPEDYEFLKEIFGELYKEGDIFFSRDIFNLLERRPGLSKINSHIIRDEGYHKSLKEDEEFLADIEKQGNGSAGA